MNPVNSHFLFNALNSIEALSREAPARIPELVRGLAEYLRYSLRSGQGEWATVQQELDAVASYLRVEKVRFEDQLQVELQIDAAARPLRIPGLLLQSLVQHAVQHGMATSTMPLRVVVRVCRLAGRLWLEVRNTGLWAAPSDGRELLVNDLRTRLEQLYQQDGYRLACGQAEGWASIAVEVPASDTTDH